MGVDRFRVCELYAAGPDVEGSGSGYRLGDRLVLTARHVIAPALAGAGGQVLVRPVGGEKWLPAQVEWHDAGTDAALLVIEDDGWRAPGDESVLRWGELAGSEPVPCAAVGFPWASARPDRMRDTAHIYGQLAPLGELRQDRLDVDVASASPTAREGGSPWAGMSGAGVIADSHLVGVITVDPARYQDRLVAVPVSRLLADERFRDRLQAHGAAAEAAPVGAGWYLQLAGGQAVSLDPPYRPVSRRFRPALSTLLRPEHGLVPFLGRQQVLDQLTGWCEDRAGRPVLLVTGGGGSGKTRLGREVCVRILLAGWDAGLADTRRDGAAVTRLERPTLVVVDDADLSAGLIAGLVGYLRRDDAGPEVRLLLLARAAGVWWDQLVRRQELEGNYTVVDLDLHPVPPADRAEHFRRARAAFAVYGGPTAQPADLPPPGELEDPAYAEPLLIHIAALLSTLAIPATSPPGPGGEAALVGGVAAGEEDQPVRQRLLRALCERERARWYQLGGQLPFNPDLPLADQVVALATLTAASDQASALSLLEAVPNQGEVTRIGAEALAVWAHNLYAGPGYWNPLRPDLVAEQHLADTPQLPTLATVGRLAAGQEWEAALFSQLLAELTRGAPGQPAIRAALDGLLAAELPRIVDLAVTADDAGLADLASLALQLAPQPHLAAELVRQMPERSVRLAALAAILTSQQVTHYRAGPVSEDLEAASRLAGSLTNLSVRLGSLGRWEEALGAAEEAVTIRRELAAARPDEFRPGLADSLNSLSNRLAELERREKGLAASQEATVIYRELAAARPEEFRLALAGSLNSLSIRLADLGRREEALAASQEATGVYRELAVARPEEFRRGLGGSLNSLAFRLGELGRREEALAAAEEAVTFRRELAAARPDEFRPGLASSLNSLATRLAELGRREEALAAAEEAVAIRRELAAARPDAFRPVLTRSLNNLAKRLAELGRREEALAAAEEVVAIRRELAAARPDAFRPAFAGSLTNLANRLAELGRRKQALAAVEKAITIYRKLAARGPDDYHRELEWSMQVAARVEQGEDSSNTTP
jgi:tetratricopeptide (TPR) repeat protein